MAFRQPTHAPQRQLSIATSPPPANDTTLSSSQQQHRIADSQEWVLFSPSVAPSTTRTHTTSTGRTSRTAGRSRLSDFGSLDTAARSIGIEDDDEDIESDGTEGAIAEGDDEQDGDELDSLDDGLHAFRVPSVYRGSTGRLDQSGGTVLPTHDGLGTFPASSSPVQEQLWQFEQYNPRRTTGHNRRRSSVQRRLDALEDEVGAVDRNNERRQRIESWRMEQSKALLDEIEKETRRRRMSMASEWTGSELSLVEEERVTMGGSETDGASTPTTQEVPREQDANEDADESLWKRITRRVIRDLMGIDDSLLSVIFGETLPPDAIPPSAEAFAEATPSQRTLDEQSLVLPTTTWEDRLLERIARELGILVNQLSEHPGAFSTYLATQEIPPYAGLPVSTSSTQQSAFQTAPSTDTPNLASTTGPHFSPTLQDPTHPSSWGMEEDSTSDPFAAAASSTLEAERLQRERDYWERELDVTMVFSFLRNRFSRSRSSESPSTSQAYNMAPTTSSHVSARRAAMIRQQHPLMARSHEHHTRLLHASQQRNLTNQLKRRSSSSCASQSNKASKTGQSGSSRNYWDIGGSVGSGSLTGGLGAWGEV